MIGHRWIRGGSRSLAVALTGLALAAVVTAGLAAGPDPAAAEGQATWAVHITLAPTWFDPAETPGIITPFMVLYALHDGLVKPMPGKAMAPSLAESWTASKDGLVYEFALRKGVRFHNGDVMTAEDVKFSFERYRGASAALLKVKVAKVEVVSPLRIRFTLKQPCPDLMTFYATPATGAAWIVPKKYVERVGDEGSGSRYVYGAYPDVDGLYAEQANEMNPRVRQQILSKIQQLIHERAMFGPVIEPAFLNGVGPRLEVHGLGLIANHAYSAPYEDVRLRRP